MSPKELKEQFGISLGELSEGSYGIWVVVQPGHYKKAVAVTIDLPHQCWVTELGKFYFKDRKKTWGLKRRELDHDQ